MGRIHTLLITFLAFLLLKAGGRVMVKEEAAAPSAIQARKGFVVGGKHLGEGNTSVRAAR